MQNRGRDQGGGDEGASNRTVHEALDRGTPSSPCEDFQERTDLQSEYFLTVVITSNSVIWWRVVLIGYTRYLQVVSESRDGGQKWNIMYKPHFSNPYLFFHSPLYNFSKVEIYLFSLQIHIQFLGDHVLFISRFLILTCHLTHSKYAINVCYKKEERKTYRIGE